MGSSPSSTKPIGEKQIGIKSNSKMEIQTENQPNDNYKDTFEYEQGPVDADTMSESEAHGSVSTISNSRIENDAVNGIPNNTADDEQIVNDREQTNVPGKECETYTHKDTLSSEDQLIDDDDDIEYKLCKEKKGTNASVEKGSSTNQEYVHSSANVEQPNLVTEEPSQTDHIEPIDGHNSKDDTSKPPKHENDRNEKLLNPQTVNFNPKEEVGQISTDIQNNKLKEQHIQSQQATDGDHETATLESKKSITTPELIPETAKTNDANNKTKEDKTSNFNSNAKDNSQDACSNNGKPSKETHCSQKGRVQHNITLKETGPNTKNCETNPNENSEININRNAENPLDKSNENESDKKCDNEQKQVDPGKISKKNCNTNPEKCDSQVEKEQQINPLGDQEVSNDIDTDSTVNTTAKSSARYSDKEPEKVKPDEIYENNASNLEEINDSKTSPKNDTGEQATTVSTAQGPNDPRLNANLEFYQNKIKSSPYPGYNIEEMLTWHGDFQQLERNHRYIQWLFPLYETSYHNTYAQSLQLHEAEAIREDQTLKNRVLHAFKMMLNFYGMKISSADPGKITRAKDIWKDRYQHLNKSGHNYLRITRIIRSIGYLGYQHLQYPWLEFILRESQSKGTLLSNLLGGNMGYWINALENSDEQELALQQWTMSRDDDKASSDAKKDKTGKSTKHDEERTDTTKDSSNSLEDNNGQQMNSNTKKDKAAKSSEQMEDSEKKNKDQNVDSEVTNKTISKEETQAVGKDNHVKYPSEKQVDVNHKNNADATFMDSDDNKHTAVRDKHPNETVKGSFTSGESGSYVLNPNKEGDTHTNSDDAQFAKSKANLDGF